MADYGTMAIEHVWVQLQDSSRVRGDQVTSFSERLDDRAVGGSRVGRRSYDSYSYGIEVFGSSASDKFRKLCDKQTLADGVEGDFIAQLYFAAAQATEASPRLLTTIVGTDEWNGTKWTSEPLRLSD